MARILEIKGLTVRFYTYEGVVQAVDNVDLEINRQETLGLVGETGCGKTMTALAILRLIPPPGKIDGGQIFLHPDSASPVDLMTLTEKQMRQIRGSTVAMVFQEPSAALNPVFTINDQISEVILVHRRQEAAGRALADVDALLAGNRLLDRLARPARRWQRHLYQQLVQTPQAFWPGFVGRVPIMRRLLWRLKREAQKMAVAMLKEVEIPDPERVARAYPHQLSGGMKQRSVIAMSLACCQQLLIADEPTTALDVTIQAQILELLQRLKDNFQTSVLYITHDLAVAAQICDRIVVMYAGRICEIASALDLFAHPTHPYTRLLLAAVPRPGVEPQSIKGTLPDPLSLSSGCHFHPRCPLANEQCQQQPRMVEAAPGHFVACFNWRGENGGNSG